MIMLYKAVLHWFFFSSPLLAMLAPQTASDFSTGLRCAILWDWFSVSIVNDHRTIDGDLSKKTQDITGIYEKGPQSKENHTLLYAIESNLRDRKDLSSEH